MKILKSLSALSLLALLFSGCGPEEPRVITFDDIEEDFKEIPIDQGTQDVQIEISPGYFWSFRVLPPSQPITGDVPLVMTFHGASGGSAVAHQQTACYVEPGLEGLNAFVISPNAGLEEWYHESNQEKVFHLVRMALTYWPIDSEKIAVMGYSNGGNATWFYSEYQAATFSAGIAMASSYDTSIDSDTGRKIDVPLYVIHSDEDELFPIEITEDWVNKSINAGSEIEWVVAEGLSHFSPCDYVPYLKDAVTWMEETVWN